MIRHLIVICSSIAFTTLNAQKPSAQSPSKLPFPKLKQQANFSRAPGSYRIVLDAERTNISPGDTVNISLRITGYGFIDPQTAKLYVNSSENIFDPVNSVITPVFGRDNPRKWSEFGVTTIFSGTIWDSKKIEHTVFDDLSAFPIPEENTVQKDTHELGTNFILSESNIPKKEGLGIFPLQRWSLVVKDNAKSGSYHLNHVFTYFNGYSWHTNQDMVEFKVQPWYDEHEGWLQFFAGLGLIIAIVSFLYSIPKYLKAFVNNFKRTTGSLKKVTKKYLKKKK